jgi:hypothetical protein
MGVLNDLLDNTQYLGNVSIGNITVILYFRDMIFSFVTIRGHYYRLGVEGLFIYAREMGYYSNSRYECE